MSKAKSTAKAKPKKKAAKKKSSTKIVWNPEKKLTDREELFLRYYVQNDDTRFNATHSYNLAYGKKLEEKSKDDAVWGTRVNRHGKEEEYIEKKSSYELCENVCAVEGRKLLRKPQIERRKVELLNEMLTNEMVDAELTKVIKQDQDRPSKVRAINEFNKLGGRIIAKESHIHQFANEDMTDKELLERIERNKKFFEKK